MSMICRSRRVSPAGEVLAMCYFRSIRATKITCQGLDEAGRRISRHHENTKEIRAGRGRLISWRSRSSGCVSRDGELPRELRVVLEEGLLPLELFLGRLHRAGDIGHARDDRMLAGRGAGPRVSEQFPGVFAAR